jgi:hypothetical protein
MAMLIAYGGWICCAGFAGWSFFRMKEELDRAKLALATSIRKVDHAVTTVANTADAAKVAMEHSVPLVPSMVKATASVCTASNVVAGAATDMAHSAHRLSIGVCLMSFCAFIVTIIALIPKFFALIDQFVPESARRFIPTSKWIDKVQKLIYVLAFFSGAIQLLSAVASWMRVEAYIQELCNGDAATFLDWLTGAKKEPVAPSVGGGGIGFVSGPTLTPTCNTANVCSASSPATVSTPAAAAAFVPQSGNWDEIKRLWNEHRQFAYGIILGFALYWVVKWWVDDIRPRSKKPVVVAFANTHDAVYFEDTKEESRRKGGRASHKVVDRSSYTDSGEEDARVAMERRLEEMDRADIYEGTDVVIKTKGGNARYVAKDYSFVQDVVMPDKFIDATVDAFLGDRWADMTDESKKKFAALPCVAHAWAVSKKKVKKAGHTEDSWLANQFKFLVSVRQHVRAWAKPRGLLKDKAVKPEAKVLGSFVVSRPDVCQVSAGDEIGCGFAVKKKLITAWHVVEKDPSKVTVELNGQKKILAFTRVGDKDLAVCDIPNDFKIRATGTSPDKAHAGATCIAFYSGEGQCSSGPIGKVTDEMMLHGCSTAKGWSGCPVVAKNGVVFVHIGASTVQGNVALPIPENF